MKIEIQKTELLTAVKRVLPFVKRKTHIPILANFLFAASQDAVSITGTDLDSSLTVTRSARVKTEGKITIPARKLSDVLAKLKTIDAEYVTLTAADDKFVTLSCGPLTVKLPGMTACNFPSLPKLSSKSETIPGAVLTGLIRRTRHAISTQESRYTLNAALLTIDSDRIRMVTTDGHRLALAEHSGTFAGTTRVLVPLDALDRLPALLDNSNVTFAATETHIFVCASDWEMVSRVVTGQFPNWEAVMPKNNAKRVTFPAKQLKETISRIVSFADERSRATRWQLIGGTGLKLSASNTETGEAAETVKVSCEDDAVIGLNGDFVLDILGTIDKDREITFAVKSADCAALWTPAETDGYESRYVLMPMRI